LRSTTASSQGRRAMSAGTMQPVLASRHTAAMLRRTVDLPVAAGRHGVGECVGGRSVK
jgi:hypothetical protein